MTATATAAPPIARAAASQLSFEERLALAALAVDARIATTPLDLADVIRLPVETPQPSTPCPYDTPLAAVLHRARVRLETAGWCTGQLRDEQGAACLIGAIRSEAASRGQADDACALLLQLIQRDFGDDHTIPSWNDTQNSPRPVLLYLDRAAEHAHNHNL
ncbi:hypothetical protein ACIF8T_21610 [Streptomyces sp. NPDC085946]|uniref:DUF6197 family protein n=1 Tax=Streptomyces sp. NPDC085946 TaxID=3365744 RepID=UPI0037D70F18